MKLWRKLAKKDKDGKRNGRELTYQLRMSEQFSKFQPKTNDFIDALFQRAGIKFVMSKKEEAKLKEMIASVNEEKTDETK